jgi:hypothetical protein
LRSWVLTGYSPLSGSGLLVVAKELKNKLSNEGKLFLRGSRRFG